MRIYSMTATFGKLEHETLTFQPGLNIIEAPNEWGKSTWCAFLIAMLYGIETRAHTTKTALADKERYAPWSGAPMSGRIDLCWNGRDITIERQTKGRSIFGDFKAYETATGLPVPELTAAECGQMLLGVEKSVFTRTSFLKLNDLPVTQDESLRRRLNALVTTGDESGAGDQLAQKLRDLKNRCRFNKSGLLPQAEAQRDEISRKLQELEALQEQSVQLRQRQTVLEAHIAQLENHQAALQYAAAQEDRQQVAAAMEEKERTANALEAAQRLCQDLPPQEQAEQAIRDLQNLQQQTASLQEEAHHLPDLPQPPGVPAPFQGMATENILEQVESDIQYYQLHSGFRPYAVFIIPGILAMVGAMSLMAFKQPLYAGILLGVALVSFALGILKGIRLNKTRKALEKRYASPHTAHWLSLAQQYKNEQEAYAQAVAAHEVALAQLNRRRESLQQRMDQLTDGAQPASALDKWQQVLRSHASYADAQKEFGRAVSLLTVAQTMAKDAPAPQMPDTLTYSKEETARRLSDSLYQQRQLHMLLGQCLGQMERLGQEEALKQQLEAITARIERLEDTYAALSIAQQTLADATAELQRRFAPRISRRAQELFGILTNGRYNRLTLSQDLRLNAGAQGEDTLLPSLWRSDGTVDQLYLALRLAVAEELTPQSPLILDDALVRFDDKRLAAAMDILRQEAKTKQVILFTCQGRENKV